MGKYTIELSKRQTTALNFLEDNYTDELLYGGAKGGGKSVLLCLFMFLYAKNIIKEFKLSSQKYPIAVGFMGRKRGVDFNDTTLESWKRIIPSESYELKTQDKEVVIENRVKICYGGLDDESNVKKFNSAEFGAIAIDQAEEINPDERALLIGTLRLKINNLPVKYKILYTANPAPSFLKQEFVLSQNPKRKFLQALPSDNPFLPVDYVPRLREAFRHRPELIKAYIDGSWDELGSGDLVIQYSWAQECVLKNLTRPFVKKIISADIGRFGGDETVIYAWENERIVDSEIFSHTNLMETAGRIVRMRRKHNSSLIVLDNIGIGAGVEDRLRELKEPVSGINSAEKASDDKRYKNKRAEMWWQAGEKFADRQVSLCADPILINQLCNVKYFVNSAGQIQIEKKEDITSRTGSSPDRADAAVMGLYGLQLANYIEVHERAAYSSSYGYGFRNFNRNVDPNLAG